MKFGENLYCLRKGAKMSQEKLAEEVGVSRQSVSKWENGESYPEMDNILKICKIFHCKINDLVHDDLQDIDSLDEEIKMNVVKLERKKQKKLKVISKIMYVLAKISRIACGIAVVGIILASIAGIIFTNNVDAKSRNLIEVHVGDQTIVYEKDENNQVIVHRSNPDEKVSGELIVIESPEDMDNVYSFFANRPKSAIIAWIVMAAMLGVGTIVLLWITLLHLEKLFKNINEGDTPFTLENVAHIKLMSYFMIATTIVSSICMAVVAIAFGKEVNINIGYNLVQILFIYSIAYIFEYGYNIQKDSQSKIYGEETEDAIE